MHLHRCLLLVIAIGLPACVPHLPMQSRLELEPARVQELELEFRSSPQPLARRVVVINGYRSPSFLADRLAGRLAALTSGCEGDFLTVSAPLGVDIERIADLVVQTVHERWPGAAQGRTIPVDVVGISMGGLVARTAALPERAAVGKRMLDIHRLMTLGTPHQGARAALLPLDPALAQMQRGSPLLQRLDEALADAPFSLTCYTHDNDLLVGADRAAPPGRQALWTSGTLIGSHFTTTSDRAILIDIASRLRAP